jgi:CBS domain containing-hemolysin-like protein
MLKMKNDTDDPSSMRPAAVSLSQGGDKGGRRSSHTKQKQGSIVKNLMGIFSKQKNGTDSLREALEEYMEELEDDTLSPSIAAHETALISNVLKLRDTTVTDVMIPRVDIAAIDINASQDDLMALLSERQFSRIPVYRDTMDDILGTVHIKDILSHLASRLEINIKSLIRPVPIVSPSLPILDLLTKMQSDKKHMVLVVDEYGGIDGLVTIGDVIEAIVGEFDDEFDEETAPQMVERDDGSVVADARLDIEDFEDKYGEVLSEEEREEVDTLGGLVFYTASRIPARGEVIKHDSGMVFEIMEADQRRISRLRIRNIPKESE